MSYAHYGSLVHRVLGRGEGKRYYYRSKQRRCLYTNDPVKFVQPAVSRAVKREARIIEERHLKLKEG